MWSNLTARLSTKNSQKPTKPKSPTKKKSTGDAAERIAKLYLSKQGLKPIDQNVHFRFGEIDLIAMDGPQLVFVEVRYRKSSSHGGSLASVDARKQQKIIKAAQLYLQQTYGNQPPSCRFDVIGISGHENTPEIQWIKNAFC